PARAIPGRGEMTRGDVQRGADTSAGGHRTRRTPRPAASAAGRRARFSNPLRQSWARSSPGETGTRQTKAKAGDIGNSMSPAYPGNQKAAGTILKSRVLSLSR